MVQIKEAKFGGAKLGNKTDEANYRIKPHIIQGFISQGNTKGAAFNLDKLDMSIMLANELPGAKVQATLEAGEGENETDVVFNVENKKPWAAGINVDNFGSRGTGKTRYIANGSLYSPLRLGDQLDFLGLHTEGSDFARIAYALPIGGRGLKVGLNNSFLKYDVLPALDSSDLKPKGYSRTSGINATYPLYRSKVASLNLGTDYDRKYFKNNNINGNQNEYAVNVFSVSANGFFANQWLYGGQTTGSLISDIGRTGVYQEATGLSLVQGHFSRFRWNVAQTQFLREDISATLRASGQLSNRNLNSSEKFYLGGTAGVRAYPTSEGYGSEGFLINAELRKSLPYNFYLTGFYDFGHVKQNVSGDPSSGPNTYSMKGYGTSIDWAGPYNSNFSAIWARRIGENPQPTTTGLDQDGTRTLNMIWLKGAMNF